MVATVVLVITTTLTTLLTILSIVEKLGAYRRKQSTLERLQEETIALLTDIRALLQSR